MRFALFYEWDFMSTDKMEEEGQKCSNMQRNDLIRKGFKYGTGFTQTVEIPFLATVAHIR